MIEWNARRLAVLDRDIDAIIRTHARERKVAAWLEDTAETFEEIGEIDLAMAGRSRRPTSTVDNEPTKASAQHYRIAASVGKDAQAGQQVGRGSDELIAELRETHRRRRPRLQQEFDRAGLP
ncbi:MAG TPA: hypothetical protein VJN19_06700 [Propionibacteriaceae bacterium]|nr:hypothetical protein [Propionibacteriaceae bacterium]